MSSTEVEILHSRIRDLERENEILRERRSLFEASTFVNAPDESESPRRGKDESEPSRQGNSALRFCTWLWNMSNNTTKWSPALYDMCGFDRSEEPRIERFLEMIHPEDLPEIQRRMTDSKEQTHQQVMDFRLIQADGSVMHVTGGGSTLVHGNDTLMLGALVDRSDERKLRERMDQTLSRLTEIMRLSGAMSWHSDASGQVSWTAELRKLLDYPNKVSPSIEAILGRVHPEDLPAFKAAIDQIRNGTKSSLTLMCRLVTHHRILHIVAGFTPLDSDGNSVACTYIDKSERVEMRSQLLKRAQFEQSAYIATNMTSEVGNVLSVIGTAADILKQRHPDDDDVELVMQASQDASRMSGGLLAYLQAGSCSLQAINVSEAAAEGLRIAQDLLSDEVVLSVDLTENLPPVLLDPQQLQRSILNLVQNARDAIDGMGHIRVRTAAAKAGWADDERLGVELVVTDDGAGMSGETLRCCREPFFTTKSDAGAIGLGLTICESIQSHAEGRLEVIGAPGAGTTVRLWWPCADPSDA